MSISPFDASSTPVAGELELPCTRCWSAVVRLPASAEKLVCPKCAATYSFRTCSHCGAVGQASPKAGRGGFWQCTFCRRKNDIPLVGKWPTATAAARHEELEARRMLTGEPDIKLLGGFTVVGGNGLGLPVSGVCSILTRPDAVYIEVEIGDETTATIPYEELTTLDLSGGARTTGRRYFGGGFGLQGAVEGMIVASALSKASQKTSVNTGMHVGSVKGEAILHHGELPPQAIRTALSPLWTRYESAKHVSTSAGSKDDPATLLARLGELRAAGVVTEEEFAAKKAELLARM